MAEEKKKRKAGVRLTAPDDLVLEMQKFSAEAGVTMARLKQIVSEATFGLVKGNVRALYLAKIGADSVQSEEPATDTPPPTAPRPMGS